VSRYNRHISLQGICRAAQEKINASKVLVVGAGGLGCPVLQYLAAAGIGTIGIVDFDTVEESNLQRQILFGTTSLGRNKAKVAKEVLSNFNPMTAIYPYTEKLSPVNVVSIFEAYDIIVDATDNFTTRYLINDVTIILNKPLVYGTIYKFEGQVTVFNHNNGPSYRCVFPNPPQNGTMPNCSEVGVLGILQGIIGTLQANEVLKLVLDIGDTLSDKLYCFSALTNESNTLHFHRNELEIEKVNMKGKQFDVLDNSFFCSNDIPEIELKAIVDEDVLFIDVREFTEQPSISLENLLEISLANLLENIESIPTHKKIIAFCKSGMRSKQAVSISKQHQILNCYSLKNGVNTFAKAELKTI